MGLMSGDKPQHEMKIEKSLLLLKGRFQLLFHHNLSSYHIQLGVQMKPQVSYWTTCRPLVGGEKRMERKEIQREKQSCW